MQGIMREGDKNTGGGTVVSGAVKMQFDCIGVPVACAVQLYSCGCMLRSSLPVAGAN